MAVHQTVLFPLGATTSSSTSPQPRPSREADCCACKQRRPVDQFAFVPGTLRRSNFCRPCCERPDAPCNRCGEWLPKDTHFFVAPERAIGVRAWCRECDKQRRLHFTVVPDSPAPGPCAVCRGRGMPWVGMVYDGVCPVCTRRCGKCSAQLHVTGESDELRCMYCAVTVAVTPFTANWFERRARKQHE